MAQVNVSQYFEGVLQLRNCTEEVRDFIEEAIKKEKNVWIAKEVQSKDGTDLYISSNKFLKKLGKLLKQKFQGIVKASAKLHTADRQTGKGVYRGTILFRMPSFQKGEIGVYKGDEVEIISIGDKVAIKNIKTGKKSQHKFDDINRNFRKL